MFILIPRDYKYTLGPLDYSDDAGVALVLHTQFHPSHSPEANL